MFGDAHWLRLDAESGSEAGILYHIDLTDLRCGGRSLW